MSPVPLPWACSVLCARNWTLADHSQVLLLTQGAERGKKPSWEDAKVQPRPSCPASYSWTLPKPPSLRDLSVRALCSPQGCCTLELLCNSSWGFMQPLQVKLRFSWSSPVIPPLCCCMIRSALRGFALRLLFNAVWHYRIQKALIWKGFSLQLP